MRNRKSILLLLLFVSLLMGCVQQHSEGMFQERSHDIPEARMEVVSEQINENGKEMVQVTEPNGILVLGDVLALTLIHNPELKVFSLETRAAQARQLQAGLWPNPKLGVEVEEVGGAGNRSGFEGAETTIQLSQLIELGHKSQKRQKVASLEKELADLGYQNKRLEVFSEAAQAFVLVLKAQEKLLLSNELLKLSQASFETVKKRVDAGKDSPVEKNRASIALANIRISYGQAQRNLEYTRKHLATFWGQDEPLFERAAGDLDTIEQLPTLESLTKQLEQTPEFSRWGAEIKKRQAVLALEKSKTVGDITLAAGVQRFNETDDNAVIFGVSIPLPLSDRNQGRRQEAMYNLAKSRQEQRVAWLKLKNELNGAYRALANSHGQVTLLRNDVLPAATEMFNASTVAYREGKVDYLNVLDAHRTFFDVKNKYVGALAKYHISRTKLEQLTGQSLQEINTTVK